MDYTSFKNFRRCLDKRYLALDDLNPYPLAIPLADCAAKNRYTYANAGEYMLSAGGVREILRTLFSRFANDGSHIILPSDIYPVYFKLTPVAANVVRYKTYDKRLWQLPNCDNAVMLATNPTVPAGSYLPELTLQQLDEWLATSQKRWLILDQVYDYFNKSRDFRFNSDNVIYIGSVSKISLAPDRQGWAVSRARLAGSEKTNETRFVSTYADHLSTLYANAWRTLSAQLEAFAENWQAPELGYLSILPLSHQSLLKHGMVALPISIFGIQANNACVISCLSEVKRELRHL